MLGWVLLRHLSFVAVRCAKLSMSNGSLTSPAGVTHTHTHIHTRGSEAERMMSCKRGFCCCTAAPSSWPMPRPGSQPLCRSTARIDRQSRLPREPRTDPKHPRKYFTIKAYTVRQRLPAIWDPYTCFKLRDRPSDYTEIFVCERRHLHRAGIHKSREKLLLLFRDDLGK